MVCAIESWLTTFIHEAQLMDTIKHYSNFPATGVSLRQMVQFGSNPSTGKIYVPCRGQDIDAKGCES